ncbi:hypothetical protein BSK66_27825 [Paenibacillus odorifer]|uniref:hypothetical protein n=2 Tax=Paenibacillus TaxID=44249 RepID=UPI0003E1C422|nr:MULTISPECIES: hypothetical protein [Paenibacillus]ETT61808.1 hypothetical protein C171_11626 [Paenibacillus sp. FSL H8-237]OMD13767.1 hypothetical protein BJP47_24375 [Paenibacillus odorifer]OME48997.1 hypothetical protein BSK66_27825 [Paenibacillus odorifer]
MLTENIYSSMIGRHYFKREIKALCALIDQRIEYRLPNFALRTRLLELMSNQFIKGDADKKELEKRVMRDLAAYPAKQEKLEMSYKIQVTLYSGGKCTLDINLNTIQWTEPESGNSFTAPINYGTTWISNVPERTFSGVFEGENNVVMMSPIISRENILKTDNFAVLSVLLIVPVGETKLLLEKTCPDCKYGPVHPSKANKGNGEFSKMAKYVCSNCDSEFYM